MSDATYTLTGFGEFLERRRITFVDPLPAIRVCSICGLVPSSSQLLPCCHVVCDGPCGRQVRTAGSCPLEGRHVTTSSVMPFKFEQSELGQLLVRCLNGADTCTFTGKLSELEEHFFACECDAVECSKCGRLVCRNEAASHCKTCCDSVSSISGDASGTDASVAVEEIARMKQDLENLRELVSKEETVKEAIVEDVNSLAERAARLEARLTSVAEEIAGLKYPLPASAINVVSPQGPYRTASRRGSAITLYKLGKLNHMDAREVKGELCILQGYTFLVSCRFDSIKTPFGFCFQMILCSGPWDNYLDWPFAKRVTLIIPHLKDERKDIRVSPTLRSPEYWYYRKPHPNEYNKGIEFEKVPEEKIDNGNYIVDGDLYLNIEFF